MKAFNHLNRTANQRLPAKENPHFSEDGKSIYRMMRSKYPQETSQSIDNMLNGICASLLVITKVHIEPEKQKDFIKTIYEELLHNLERNA